MEISSDISQFQSPEAAIKAQMSKAAAQDQSSDNGRPPISSLIDVATQTEAKLFESTEVVRLINNSRVELQRRVEGLEKELDQIKKERDAAIVEAFDARRRPSSSAESIDTLPTSPSSSPAPSAVSTFRSLPSSALHSILSIFPSFKQPIARIPPRATSTVSLISRICSPSPPPPPSTQSIPPGPTFSLLLSPADSRPAPPDLLSQLSILWLGKLDPGITPFLVLYFFRLPRSEPFPRPLAISKTHSGNIIVGLKSEEEVKRVQRILSKDPVFPGFTNKFDQQRKRRGSYQFKWNHLSNETRESWAASQTLPEKDLVDPDENEERYEMEKESILGSKRISREPSLAQRISGGGNRKEKRKDHQKNPTPSPKPAPIPTAPSSLPSIPINFAPSSSNPAINFASPPVPAFMLAPFPSTPASFPSTPLPPPPIPNPFSRPGYTGDSIASIPRRRSLSAETEEPKEKKARID